MTIEIGSPVGTTNNPTNESEDEFMPLAVPKSVFSETNGNYSLNSTSSTWNDNVTGGAVGRHDYIFTAEKQELDISSESLPLTLIAKDNVQASGDGFAKTSTGAVWNSSFHSEESFDPNEQDFAISWLVEATGGTIREMCGLCSNPDSSNSYSILDYAVYQVNNTFYTVVYQKGKSQSTGKGSVRVNVGDRIGIKVIDNTVTYFIQSGDEFTDIYTSLIKATKPLHFKAALNRGPELSGASVVTGCQYHANTVTALKTVSISGLATESISEDDAYRLSKIGITPAEETLYSNINFTRQASTRFPANSSITYNHTYSVNDAQDIQTITI